ncbi:hypothetical protein [Aeromicrobium sp. Leaf350]|uniref:hypothetical protein n=1 Tax=Aeromicrobium sp. Leaf350 TaxID=2876565 RepID=UPI001E6170D5|nr:hypothetical protein [Aeromicrobium sp. Leaf350]
MKTSFVLVPTVAASLSPLWLASAAQAVDLAAVSATEAAVSVSADGATFVPQLQIDLFDTSLRWVPGDVREATFMVRNDAAADARMDITLVQKGLPAAAAEHVLVSADVPSVTDGPTVDGLANDPLLNRSLLAAGGAVPVTVRVQISPDAPDSAQLLQHDFALLVTLSTITSASAAVSTDAPETQALPDTGSADLTVLAVLASISIGVGAALLPRRRPDHEGAPQ